jgi:hypothetical protein
LQLKASHRKALKIVQVRLSKSQKMIYWIAIVVGFAVIGGVWLLNFFDVWDANPAATGFVVY